MSEYQDIPSLYGSSVFSDKEMRARLPREIYKRLAAIATVRQKNFISDMTRV